MKNKKLLLIFCMLLLVLPIVYSETTLILQTADTENIGDAKVRSGSPNDNFGTVNEFGTEVTNPVGRGYIAFDISSIPASSSIVSATLNLWEVRDDGVDWTISVHTVNGTGTWNEEQITHNNQPCGTAALLDSTKCNVTPEDSVYVDTTNIWYKWNVTAGTKRAYNENEDNVSFVLNASVGGGQLIMFASKEYATAGYRPYLNITYNVAGGPTISSFSVTAADYYDGSAINSFSVNVSNGSNHYMFYTSNGTTYITNATIPVWNKKYNFTFNATNYFNILKSDVNLTSGGSLTGNPYQAILYLNASEIITGNTITNFNATVGTQFNQSNSTGWTKFFLKAGTYTIKANASTYLNNSKQVTISALQTKTEKIEFFNSLLKINATSYIDGGKISDFSIIVTAKNFSYSISNTTSTGNLFFNLIDGKYEINFTENLGNFSKQNKSLNLELLNYYPNITFTPFTYNSINISIYDEILGRYNNLFFGRTVYFEFVSDLDSYNYSTNTSTLYVDLLSPKEYRIHYWSNLYDKRDYYFNLNNNTHSELELYLLSTGNSTDVTFTIEDDSGIELENTILYLKRYYVSTNSYRTVAMSKTNPEGEAVINVDFNDAYYQILAVYDGYSTQTTGAKIFSLTPTIKIDLQADVYENIDILNNVIADVSFNNATKTFSYSFTSFSGPVEGILEVKKVTPTGEVILYSASDTTTAGSLLYTLTSYDNQDHIVAYGIINQGERTIKDIEYFNEYIQETKSRFQTTGVFVSMLMAGTFAGLGAFSPVMSVILFLVGMVAVTYLGFSSITWPIYFLIFILGSVLVYKLKT